MTSAYCVSGPKVQLLKKFIYLPCVGSKSKDWKHLCWVISCLSDMGHNEDGGRWSSGNLLENSNLTFLDVCHCCYDHNSKHPAYTLLVGLVQQAVEFSGSTITYFPSHPRTSENSHWYWRNSWQQNYSNHFWLVKVTEEWDRGINEPCSTEKKNTA